MYAIVKCCLTLLILGFADRTFVVAQEGTTCNLPSQSGTCRRLDLCQPVYNELLAGKRPEVVCGFAGATPIVCCPNGRAPTVTSTPSEPIWGTSNPTASSSRPARRMCAEYAKAVYRLEAPPTLVGGDDQLVNVSLCAIKSKKLIVGGTEAEPKEFPHMAAIGFIRGNEIGWKCGGTLISDRYVLSAAHCTFSTEWGNAEWVRVGDLNLQTNSDDAQPQDRRITERIRHPGYKRPPQYNDLALFKLASQVEFNAYVRPACLSISTNIPVGEKAVATGWGHVDWFDEEGSATLLKVTLPIVSIAQCTNAYNDEGNKLPNGINPVSQVCAGQERKDTCQGDSGGPLQVYSISEECMYDVIGITSFGKLCGSISPGVYTRVYNYLSWIESIVWPNL